MIGVHLVTFDSESNYFLNQTILDSKLIVNQMNRKAGSILIFLLQCVVR